MKKPGVHLIITVVLLIMIAVSVIVPSPYREYIAFFSPVLFFVVLGSLISGPVCGLTVSLLAPVILWLLQKEAGPFLPEVPAAMAVWLVTSLTAFLCFLRFRSAIAASLVAVLVSRAALGISMQALAVLEKRTLTIDTYFREAYAGVWPGLLLTITAVPLVCLIMKKTGAMRRLHHEPKTEDKL